MNQIKSIGDQKKFLVAGLLAAFGFFTFAIYLPNISLVATLVTSNFTLDEKVIAVFSLYGSLVTNFTVFSAVVTVMTAALFGLNVAFILALFAREKKVNKSSAFFGTGGIVSGLFGVGCATCGSLLFTSFVPFVGGVAFLSLLPFGGEEFGLVGIALLTLSSVLLFKKINRPAVCAVPETSTGNHVAS